MEDTCVGGGVFVFGLCSCTQGDPHSVGPPAAGNAVGSHSPQSARLTGIVRM